MDSPALLSMIALVWYFLDDPTLSPNTLCPERHLQTFLLVGHNYLDVRSRSGELYIFQAACELVRNKSPAVFPLAQAEVLTALEGLLLSMAIDGGEVTFRNAVETITDTMEKGIGDAPDCAIKHYHIVIRRNWGYAKAFTRGKSYASHDGSKMSEMVGG